MNTMTMKDKGIPAADMAALEATVADLMAGIRHPEKMDEAARELDEGREEIRRRIGETNIAAELTDPDDE
jgi:hypothetical protein